jgi:hypothetical protein
MIHNKALCDIVYDGFYKIAFGAAFGALMYSFVFTAFCGSAAYLLY